MFLSLRTIRTIDVLKAHFCLYHARAYYVSSGLESERSNSMSRLLPFIRVKSLGGSCPSQPAPGVLHRSPGAYCYFSCWQNIQTFHVRVIEILTAHGPVNAYFCRFFPSHVDGPRRADDRLLRWPRRCGGACPLTHVVESPRSLALGAGPK